MEISPTSVSLSCGPGERLNYLSNVGMCALHVWHMSTVSCPGHPCLHAKMIHRGANPKKGFNPNNS